MARQTLPRTLAAIRSAVINVRWYRLCTEAVEHDPAHGAALGHNDYRRIANEYLAIALELMAAAEQMLRRANRQQLAAWLAHPDARVRQFVIERMSVRD